MFEHFYPRPPCGGRPPADLSATAAPAISIHVPLAGDDLRAAVRAILELPISIHVPLAGDDSNAAQARPPPCYFYPRPPCGGRQLCKVLHAGLVRFLSTSPCGGRPVVITGGDSKIHFYPRPPAGDDGLAWIRNADFAGFLSTSPCGGRLLDGSNDERWILFLSTSPCGGRQHAVNVLEIARDISIHVPLRGTTFMASLLQTLLKFLSTSPCGGRLWAF